MLPTMDSERRKVEPSWGLYFSAVLSIAVVPIALYQMRDPFEIGAWILLSFYLGVVAMACLQDTKPERGWFARSIRRARQR